MPVLDFAIRGEITESLDEDECEVTSHDFYYDKSKGLLPLEYDEEIITSVAEFPVTVEPMSLEEFDQVLIDGVTYG